MLTPKATPYTAELATNLVPEDKPAPVAVAHARVASKLVAQNAANAATAPPVVRPLVSAVSAALPKKPVATNVAVVPRSASTAPHAAHPPKPAEPHAAPPPKTAPTAHASRYRRSLSTTPTRTSSCRFCRACVRKGASTLESKEQRDELSISRLSFCCLWWRLDFGVNGSQCRHFEQ